MILADFAKYLQSYNEEIYNHKIRPIELLHKWLYNLIRKNPKNNVEKIIHKEILFAKNKNGDCFIAGKSESGRRLVTALINFCKSYENYNYAKWLENTEKSYYLKNCNDK